MKHLIPFITLGLIVLTGCQRNYTQRQIERKITYAILQGQSAEDIRQLVMQADDSSQAADIGVWEIMGLEQIPTEIEKYWCYYREADPSSTPSREIFEVINRYKISVLRVLIPYGIDLNRSRTGEPFILWGEWGRPAITPELLTFLLKHGYNPNLDKDSPSPLGICALPGEGFVTYDQKYKMIKALLNHGANPNVMSMGTPILHELIMYNRDNPHQLEIIQLLLDAGADVNVVDKGGETPLDFMMSYESSGESGVQAQNIVDILKRFGAKRAAEI